MIPQFQQLSPSEKKLMYDAIPLITLLIGYSDGDLSYRERFWSEKVAKIRSYAYHESLREYYLTVDSNYQEKLDYYIEKLPLNVDRRATKIVEKLEKLNAILPKLDHVFAWRYYNSLKSFAVHVARASGGLLGWSAISDAERKYLELNMISPIILKELTEKQSM